MRFPTLVAATSLAALLPSLPAQDPAEREDLRAEIRRIVREEVRAAVREALREQRDAAQDEAAAAPRKTVRLREAKQHDGEETKAADVAEVAEVIVQIDGGEPRVLKLDGVRPKAIRIDGGDVKVLHGDDLEALHLDLDDVKMDVRTKVLKLEDLKQKVLKTDGKAHAFRLEDGELVPVEIDVRTLLDGAEVLRLEGTTIVRDGKADAKGDATVRTRKVQRTPKKTKIV